MRFALQNDCVQLPEVLARIEVHLQEQGVPPDAVMTARLGLEEILTNTLSCAFPDGGSHEVAVNLVVADWDLSLEVVDDGIPFDPLHEAPEPDVDAAIADRAVGGLGIHLVKSLMDQVRYRRAGDHNHLEMVKHL